MPASPRHVAHPLTAVVLPCPPTAVVSPCILLFLGPRGAADGFIHPLDHCGALLLVLPASLRRHVLVLQAHNHRGFRRRGGRQGGGGLQLDPARGVKRPPECLSGALAAVPQEGPF